MPTEIKPYLPISIHSMSFCYANTEGIFSGTSLASAAWPSANRAIFCPIFIPWYYPVKRVFWGNGTGTINGNVDLGIYTDKGTRLYSTGSTAQSGASVNQFVTPGTLFILSPGRYWFALASSSSTGTFARSSTLASATARMFGWLDQDSAFALPADMSGAGTIATAYYPFFGVTRTATGYAS